MSIDAHKQALHEAVEHFNDPARRERYFEIFDQACAFHGFPPMVSPDLPGIRQFYEALWNAFPDGRLVIEDSIAEGERLAARYSFAATHKAEFLGIPATGRRVSLKGMTFLRFGRGKCIERWNTLDGLDMLAQLGVMPAIGTQ